MWRGGTVMKQFYDNDPRELPAYGLADSSHYLAIPLATLRSWVRGRSYETTTGKQFFEPVIQLPDPREPMLSFMNLVEAHILDALRRIHEIPLLRIRKAIEFLSNRMHSEHPLAEEGLRTNDIDLFYDLLELKTIINVSKWQLAFRDIVEPSLHRIEHDADGLAKRLFPFTRSRKIDAPRLIVIDPLVSFGRPVILDSGVPTGMVAERYKAGESVDELAEDYGLQRNHIEEAIRYELAA